LNEPTGVRAALAMTMVALSSLIPEGSSSSDVDFAN